MGGWLSCLRNLIPKQFAAVSPSTHPGPSSPLAGSASNSITLYSPNPHWYKNLMYPHLANPRPPVPQTLEHQNLTIITVLPLVPLASTDIMIHRSTFYKASQWEVLILHYVTTSVLQVQPPFPLLFLHTNISTSPASLPVRILRYKSEKGPYLQLDPMLSFTTRVSEALHHTQSSSLSVRFHQRWE